MAITTTRIWYICNKCGEFFYYPEDDLDDLPDKCPDCNEGVLIKSCANCGYDLSECKCD